MFSQAVPQPIQIEALTSKFEAATLDGTDVLVAGVSVLAGFVLGAVTRMVVRRLLTPLPGLKPGTVNIVSRVCGYAVTIFGVVIGLSALGLSFGPVITLLLFVTLIAVLVGRPLLADLGAGVVLQSRRPISVGDVVRIAEHEGVIEDIDARVVHLRTYDGWIVRTRNSYVLDGPIMSMATPDRVRVEFLIGVHYDTDLDRAVEIAADALDATDGVFAEPRAQVLVDEFDDSTINLKCWIWADPITRWNVKDVAHRNVKRALDDSGIVIAFPQRVVHMA